MLAVTIRLATLAFTILPFANDGRSDLDEHIPYWAYQVKSKKTRNTSIGERQRDVRIQVQSL